MLRIFTYNVHMWLDVDRNDNYGRILGLLSEVRPDIICLNEAPIDGSNRLTFCRDVIEATNGTGDAPILVNPGLEPEAQHSNGKVDESNVDGVFMSNLACNCMLMLSEAKRRDIEKFVLKFNRSLSLVLSQGRCCVGMELEHPTIGKIGMYTTHLDHIDEKVRMEQIRSILSWVDESACNFVIGDFNALKRSDYSDEYYGIIEKDRIDSNWELPKFEVTEFMESRGYTDVWRRLNPQSLDLSCKTCRFDSRIDYIWASAKMTELIDWDHPDCQANIIDHVDHSDHYPVMADLYFKE